MVRVNMVSVPDYGFWYQHATATLLFSFYGGLETVIFSGSCFQRALRSIS